MAALGAGANAGDPLAGAEEELLNRAAASIQAAARGKLIEEMGEGVAAAQREARDLARELTAAAAATSTAEAGEVQAGRVADAGPDVPVAAAAPEAIVPEPVGPVGAEAVLARQLTAEAVASGVSALDVS